MSRRTSAPGASGAFVQDGRPVSWVRDGSWDGRPVVLLAHGAGAPYTSPFMQHVAEGLVQRELDVVRFHFPYMETNVRERKRRPPDRPPVLLATSRAMLELVGSWPEGRSRSIVVAGKSLGGRMFSMLLAEPQSAVDDLLRQVQGAVYLGYPLHAPGAGHKLRADHLPAVRVPQLFVSGSRDALCKLELLRPIVEKLRPRARLHVVEGGDHSLAPGRKQPFEGSRIWLDAIAEFVNGVTRSESGARKGA